MSKYKVLRKCFWNKRVWNEGNIVDIESTLNPPHHFSEIAEEEPIILEKQDIPMALSQMAKKPKVVGGFGSSIQEPEELTVKRKKP